MGTAAGGGGGADQSAFKSNDARGGISGLLGANGEMPVIGVNAVADNGSLVDATEGVPPAVADVVAAVVVDEVVMVRGKVVSGGSSSI